MGFRGGTYRLNFCYDFLKLFLKIEKLISFVGMYIFFQSVPKNKNYTQISSKQRRRATKKICKNLNFFFEFFSSRDYILVYVESFDSFNLDEKVMDNLIWGHLEHFFEKNNL